MSADNGAGLLDVRRLSVSRRGAHGWVEVLRDVSLSIGLGESVGIVGESGSGKSTLALALLKLLPQTDTRYTGGSVMFEDHDILQMKPRQLASVRGGRIAMVFQDPVAYLHPAFTIGNQIVETLRRHRRCSRAAAKVEAIELLERVGLAADRGAYDSYAYELSGGMCQRALIANALAGQPRLLLADEPTTALDVTIQAQVLGLLASLREKSGLALLMISHDLAIISHMCDRIVVLYAGQVVESGTTREILEAPRHPYTAALVSLATAARPPGGRLPIIAGSPPRTAADQGRCAFADRCRDAHNACRTGAVPLRPEFGIARVRCTLTRAPSTATAS